jgi:uncharacterized membrane protein
VPNSSQLTAQASRKLGALLPLDVQHTTSSGARWGFEAERVKLAWSTGIRKHTSAQRRQGSGAGTWLVGGFEFGYLLQCGGGGAGRERHATYLWALDNRVAPRTVMVPQ